MTMTLTEEEARKKWCPFVSMDGHNRIIPYGGAVHTAHCIASECMAWRWRAEPETTADPETTSILVRERGYCGLAGTP